MLTQQEIREWASAYIEAERSPHKLKADYPLWWAINRFMEKMTPAWAEECWKAILEVLSQQPPPEVLALLAAGPLEDLIDDQGQVFIERIERQAALDQRSAISSVEFGRAVRQTYGRVCKKRVESVGRGADEGESSRRHV